MSRTEIILYTLILYKVVLLGIGIYSGRRTKDSADFFLGGKNLGPVLAALSAVASASSAWTLLSLSGIAFAWGFKVVWIFVGIMFGSILNWFLLAPRLRDISHHTSAITVNDIIAGESEGIWRTLILSFSAGIIIFSFTFHIASQFQGAGTAFSATFGMHPFPAIILGGAIIIIYSILGGFWAVSITDTLQGMLMVCIGILLPVSGLLAVGGMEGLMEGLSMFENPGFRSVWGGETGLLRLNLPMTFLGVGLATMGQPHLLTRYMAIKHDASLKQAQVIAMSWQVIMFGGMILLGFCGKILLTEVTNRENIFFMLTDQLLPPILSGIVLASVLSAIMSTADSQLLVAASTLAHDLKHILKLDKLFAGHILLLSRLMLIVIGVVAMSLALFIPKDIYSRVLFAWNALGSSFGPIIFLVVLGRTIKGPAIFFSIFTGFILTVIFSFSPETSGGIIEKLIPFLLAVTVGYTGSERKPY